MRASPGFTPADRTDFLICHRRRLFGQANGHQGETRGQGAADTRVMHADDQEHTPRAPFEGAPFASPRLLAEANCSRHGFRFGTVASGFSCTLHRTAIVAASILAHAEGVETVLNVVLLSHRC